MYEKLDDATRSIEQAAKDFARARNDPVAHTGHLLYGVFVNGFHTGIPCLRAVPDGALKIAHALTDALPQGLVRQRHPESPFSEAYPATLKHALLNARSRGSGLISVSDLVLAMLATGPNVATHLLDVLAVDRGKLARGLEAERGT
jgi:ATP-dependent Clp protease ATP-binding subunit ClpA